MDLKVKYKIHERIRKSESEKKIENKMLSKSLAIRTLLVSLPILFKT